MAVIITDHRTVINEADSTTGWTGVNSLFTSNPDPVESTGCLGSVISTTTSDVYFTITATDYSDDIIYIWTRPFGTMDTLTNGGIGVYLSDGTNSVSFHIAGSDSSSFRYNEGPVEWQCVAIDTTALPTLLTNRGGTPANLNLASITRVGITYKTLQKALGGVSNCFTDIMRYFTPGANDNCAITVSGGTSVDPGNFLQLALADRGTGDLQAYGVFHRLATSSYGIQAPIRFGDTGTGSSWFEDFNSTVVFEARDFATTRYKIFITDNGVGTTTFKLGNKVGTGTTATGSDGCNIIVPSGVGAEFDSQTNTNVTDVFLYGSFFSGFTNGFKMRTSQEFIDSTLTLSGTFSPKGALVYNSTVSSPSANVGMIIDSPSEVSNVVNSLFSGCNNAIEITAAGEYDFDNLTFIGNTYDILNSSTGTVTINALNGTNVSTFINTNGGSTVINNAKTFTITNVAANTEIRILRQSDLVELAGAEDVGNTTPGTFNTVIATDPVNSGRYTVSYTYSYSADIDVFVVAHSLSFQWLRSKATLSDTNSSLQISQLSDRQYQNP